MTGAGIRVQTIGIGLFLSLCGGLPPRGAAAT